MQTSGSGLTSRLAHAYHSAYASSESGIRSSSKSPKHTGSARHEARLGLAPHRVSGKHWEPRAVCNCWHVGGRRAGVSAHGEPDRPSVVGSVLGHPVRRREDPRLITGTGRFVDDVQVEAGTVAVFVRSTIAHARVLTIETDEAAAMPGVVGVFTDDSLGLPPRKGQPGIPDHFDRPILARDVVRFVGEPVAVVVAESRGWAVDAAQAVRVDYEPLPAVVDPVAATDEAGVLLFREAGTNVC